MEQHGILDLRRAEDPPLFAHFLQKVTEDLLYTRWGYSYRYALLEEHDPECYGELYGSSCGADEKKNFCWAAPRDAYTRDLYGCQKAFAGGRSIFLGEYIHDNYRFGIEVAVGHKACVYTIRCDIGYRMDLRHDILEVTDRDPSRAINAWNRFFRKALEQALPQGPGEAAAVDRDDDTFTWEEFVKHDELTIGSLWEDLNRICGACRELAEAFFAQCQEYLRSERESLEEERRYRDDHIDPRDYYGSDDWY